MRLVLFTCIFLLTLAAACGSGASRKAYSPPTHSKASLIVGQSAFQPGAHTDLGIQFVTENGWHIYWQNPGDSGEPPRIQWQLPAGVTVGALQWPAPKRLKTTAGTDYGYEGTTILLSTLQLPPTVQPGTTIEVSGDLRWLACHDICVPQRSQLHIPIRIAKNASADGAAQLLLQTAAERIPKPLPRRYHPAVTSTSDTIQLTLASTEPIRQAEFFSGEAEQIDDNAPQTLTSSAGGLRLTLKKSENIQHNPKRLKGVIVLNGRDPYDLDAPVHSATTHK
jgi:thiol:disulfide interchange protein DsbD